MGGNNEFFENLKRNKYLKKLPSMQKVKCHTGYVFKLLHLFPETFYCWSHRSVETVIN